jgi:uncharacterized FlaG/YvyC family protein
MNGEDMFVSVEDKHFVGVGKMIFNTPNTAWNIPHLHFLVDKAAGDRYEATLLEFGLVSAGEGQEEAIERLARQTHLYISTVMQEDENYSQFINNVNDHVMDDYWRKYRAIEFALAQTGGGLSHAIDKELEMAVKKIINEKTSALIDEIARNSAEEVVREAKRMAALTAAFDFEYQVVDRKAA